MKKLFLLKNHINCFGKTAGTVLLLGINLILPGLLALFFNVANAASEMPSDVLIHIYAPMLEYFIMSITIVIIWALLFDITEKDIKSMKNR